MTYHLPLPLHASASEMRCFQRCPREWQHRYADRREPLRGSEKTDRGTRVHRWLAAFWSCQDSRAAFDALETPQERALVRGYSAYYERPSLRDVRTSVAWKASVGGVPCVGELDALGMDPLTGQTIVVEHKTTTSDISPGSVYWRRVTTCDVQISMYAAALPEARVLYDVLRVPDLRRELATPPEKRKYTKPTKTEPSRLYANQRERDETDAELEARCLEAIAENPAAYFQRSYVVRLEKEHRAFAEDVRAVSISRGVPQPRNTSSCYAFGRECGYFGVCFGGRRIDDDSIYKDVER